MTKIYTVSVEELDGKSLVRFSNDMIEDIGWTTGDTAQIELQRLPADEQPSYVHIEAEEPDGSTVSEYWEDHKAYTLEITSTEQQMKKKRYLTGPGITGKQPMMIFGINQKTRGIL